MATDAIARLEAVAARLEAYAAKLSGGSSGSGESKGHPALGAYDDLLAGPAAAFQKAAQDVKQDAIAGFAKKGLAEVRSLIEASFHCKKPSDKKYLANIQKVISDADRAVGRKDEPFFAHQKSFAEAIQALGWVDAASPAAVIEGQLEAADFYLNQVLTAAKKASSEEEKATHRAYVKTMKELLTALAEFGRSNFKMGIIYNPKGGDLSSYKPGEGSSSSSSSSSGGPPAAPPVPFAPPAPALPPSSESSAPPKASGGGMSAIFDSINAGATANNATQAFGLKHVSKDMKSKNITAPVLTPKEKKDNELKAAKALVASESKKKGEAKTYLDKGTWIVENYENAEISVPEVQMKQAVYIQNCSKCQIVVPEKCKQITMDRCSKTVLQFKNVVSTFEIVNSTGCKAQVDEAAPAVAIDKTQGFSLILTAESFKNPPDIVTSNVSELNLVRPAAKEGDDPIEVPLPEQYLTRIDRVTGKLTTNPVSHGG